MKMTTRRLSYPSMTRHAGHRYGSQRIHGIERPIRSHSSHFPQTGAAQFKSSLHLQRVSVHRSSDLTATSSHVSSAIHRLFSPFSFFPHCP
jgi:hypothetical protein